MIVYELQGPPAWFFIFPVLVISVVLITMRFGAWYSEQPELECRLRPFLRREAVHYLYLLIAVGVLSQIPGALGAMFTWVVIDGLTTVIAARKTIKDLFEQIVGPPMI